MSKAAAKEYRQLIAGDREPRGPVEWLAAYGAAWREMNSAERAEEVAGQDRPAAKPEAARRGDDLMDLTGVFAEDWSVVDDVQTVTLLYTAAGAARETEVESAWKTSEEKREVQAGPALVEATYCRWHLWAAKLSGVTPAKGMKIRQASGTVWHAEAATRADEGQRYVLDCRKDRTT